MNKQKANKEAVSKPELYTVLSAGDKLELLKNFQHKNRWWCVNLTLVQLIAVSSAILARLFFALK